MLKTDVLVKVKRQDTSSQYATWLQNSRRDNPVHQPSIIHLHLLCVCFQITEVTHLNEEMETLKTEHHTNSIISQKGEPEKELRNTINKLEDNIFLMQQDKEVTINYHDLFHAFISALTFTEGCSIFVQIYLKEQHFECKNVLF